MLDMAKSVQGEQSKEPATHTQKDPSYTVVLHRDFTHSLGMHGKRRWEGRINPESSRFGLTDGTRGECTWRKKSSDRTKVLDL